MVRRKVILAPYPRTVREILAEADFDRLSSFADIAWGSNEEVAPAFLAAELGDAWAYVGTRVPLDRAAITGATALKVIVETSGSFPKTLDYAECFARGIRVLSCAPAFGRQVAEMALAMTLASGRGLIEAHNTFRHGEEAWLGEPLHSAFNAEADKTHGEGFTLFGRNVGMVGFGSLARNLVALLRPFGCQIRAFDPWLPRAVIEDAGVLPADLEGVLSRSEITYVLATPTPENRHLLDRNKLALMPVGSLLVVLSRAHLVDFSALEEALSANRICAAIDVFPEEPLPREHWLREASNVILSAHRAAALRSERQTIGRMLVDDLELMNAGLPPVRLQQAQPELIQRLHAGA